MRALWGPLTSHLPRLTIVHYFHSNHNHKLDEFLNLQLLDLKKKLRIFWEQIRLIGWLVERAGKLLQSKGCDTKFQRLSLPFKASDTLREVTDTCHKMEVSPSYIDGTIMPWSEWDNRDGGNPIWKNKWVHFSGVTVLLSLTVFQESVSQFMPITSLQIPLLGGNLIMKMLIINNKGILVL